MAICDSDLLGKKFEEDLLQLEIKENFFKGEDFPEEKIIEIMQDMLREDATFNIIGEKSVKAAIKAGIISENEIKKIQDIPFVLILS